MRRYCLIIFSLCGCFFLLPNLLSQTTEKTPVVSYNSPKKYTIADIQVTGIHNYEDYFLIGISGLAIGDVISIPGPEITSAVKRFWKHGLFSDVKILVTKTEGNKAWLEIQLKSRPRISQIHYSGIKKGEQEELEARLGLKTGQQITLHMVQRAELVIRKYFDAKGYKEADIRINQQDDLSEENGIIVHIHIDKRGKTKIHQIHFTGNSSLSDPALKKVMKKTNEKFSLRRHFGTSLREMFSTKKFTTEGYEDDKMRILEAYNEKGYRDAIILSDSVVSRDEKSVEVYLTLEEGQPYYLKDVQFIGHTQYPTELLERLLDMRRGEVYNKKKLDQRLYQDESSILALYQNNGYLFFDLDPVEVEVDNDSISLELRIREGEQATINKIIIQGNDRVYEDIIRRELRTKPGRLFSREELIRSIHGLAQMGHFEPENIQPVPLPNPESGTVDIEYNLVSRGSDQVEFSAGWGQTGLIGKLSLKFTNFSVNNLFNPSTYKGVLPQGDGEMLTISAQTNGRYYQSYGFSFLDPWFGRKRPNSLSLTAHYSKMTGVERRFYDKQLYNQMFYPNPGAGVDQAYDPKQSMRNISLSLGYGKRLRWPDDYFQFMASLNYQVYMMKNWDYYLNFISNGTSHNINLELMLQRNSIDNPIYPRQGSQFLLSVNFTPPYSLFDKKDYKTMEDNQPAKFKWLEYHKWKFRTKLYTPLAPSTVKKMPVLMTRVEYGFLGSYNKHKTSPFETFYVGGDASSGGGYNYGVETIPIRGYSSGSLGTNAVAYSKIGMELRYPLLLEGSTNIYVLGFVEGGNAWNRLKDINPFNLKRSAGIGVRVMLPMIGLMGLDWGYGFDPVRGSREHGRGQLQFVLGQEF